MKILGAVELFYVEFYSSILYNILIKRLYLGREVDFILNIFSVSDLRNYNEVLKNCQVGEPVFLIQNGRGRFVVIDMEDYEREKAEKKLLMKLQEAVKDESAWMNLRNL